AGGAAWRGRRGQRAQERDRQGDRPHGRADRCLRSSDGRQVVSGRGRMGGTASLWAPTVDEVVDGLRDRDPATRVASARACGVRRMEQTITLLSERLVDTERGGRADAARATGRISG